MELSNNLIIEAFTAAVLAAEILFYLWLQNRTLAKLNKWRKIQKQGEQLHEFLQMEMCQLDLQRKVAVEMMQAMNITVASVHTAASNIEELVKRTPSAYSEEFIRLNLMPEYDSKIMRAVFLAMEVLDPDWEHHSQALLTVIHGPVANSDNKFIRIYNQKHHLLWSRQFAADAQNTWEDVLHAFWREVLASQMQERQNKIPDSQPMLSQAQPCPQQL